jgi:hypothetical protein
VKKKPKSLPTISEQLREYLASVDHLTNFAAKAGVDKGNLSRFRRSSDVGLTMENIDRIGRALGLRLVRDESVVDQPKEGK